MLKSTTKNSIFSKIADQEKIALEFGFYWNNIQQLLEQIKSECEEVKEAYIKNDITHLKEEVGDLISATISLSIFLDIDPETVLQQYIIKFQKRYNQLVQLVKQDGLTNLKNQPMEVLLAYWDRSKKLCT